MITITCIPSELPGVAKIANTYPSTFKGNTTLQPHYGSICFYFQDPVNALQDLIKKMSEALLRAQKAHLGFSERNTYPETLFFSNLRSLLIEVQKNGLYISLKDRSYNFKG